MGTLTKEEQQSMKDLLGMWVTDKCDSCGHAIIRSHTYKDKKNNIYCSSECYTEATGKAVSQPKAAVGKDGPVAGPPVGCEDKILDLFIEKPNEKWTAKNLHAEIGGFKRRDIRKAVNNLIARGNLERVGKKLQVVDESEDDFAKPKKGRQATIDAASKRHGAKPSKRKKKEKSKGVRRKGLGKPKKKRKSRR